MIPRGFSRIDLIVVAAIVMIFGGVASPAILSVREAARSATCRNNLKQIGVALHAYHDSYGCLPPAAIWRTDRTESMALHVSQRIDLFTGPNWVQLILPMLGENSLAAKLDLNLPVADDHNEAARLSRLSIFVCADDCFNNRNNAYRYQYDDNSKPILFARGNYAMNGGSHSIRPVPGTSAKLVVDGTTLKMKGSTREFQYFGNGVGGINTAFSIKEFANGSATTVIVDEMRAGVHPIDPRGVWSLGQISGSITWNHGVNGDAGSPNSQWFRSDDLLFGSRLHEAVGREALEREEMPCVPYININAQATSRSLHLHGVNLLMADGQTRFVTNKIEPGLWHVIHSRETPKHVLEDDFDTKLAVENYPENARDPDAGLVTASETASPFVNTIGMRFVFVHAGEFTMGVANIGQVPEETPECPPHLVRINSPFYLGVHEVTQSQFQRVMGSNPSYHVTSHVPNVKASADFPVEQVTWYQAAEFCEALSKHEEERSAGRKYRLPTEAEWEYACRAGNQAYVWNGATRQKGDASGENAGVQPPLPIKVVGSYPANEFGLFDMRGNVWEWTADWFDRDYYGRSPIDDPQGPAFGFIKVIRGGDYTFVGENCRINYPPAPPWKSSRFVGFRVICELIPQSAAFPNSAK